MKKKKDFKQKHKKLLLVLDVMMVVAILSNIGAVVLTNTLAMKKTPDVIIYEANPTARLVDEEYAAPPKHSIAEITKAFISFTVKHIFLGVILGLYLLMRYTANRWANLIGMVISVSVWFVVLLFDFWHDFGLWLGLSLA